MCGVLKLSLTAAAVLLTVQVQAARTLHIDLDPSIGFGTKTSYFVNSNNDTSNPFPWGCTPVLFWHLARHGTRNPSGDDIIDMKRRLPLLRNELVEAFENGDSKLDDTTIFGLMQWHLDLNEDDSHQLTAAGHLEHKLMGRRWKDRLESLMDINPSTAEVRSSSKQRCLDSAASFMAGMFHQELHIHEDNHLLRFYEYCEKYDDEVEHNSDTYREKNKFEDSSVFVDLYEDIEKRTGVYLSPDDVHMVWDICRFENAWYPGSWSPWCTVLSVPGIQAFDFREDLGYYYQDGYGYEITQLMTQPLWSDIINRLEKVRSVPREEQASLVLLFSHDTGIQAFISSLGICKDHQPLKASDWPAYDRKWRTSRISSFAANVDLAVLKCDHSENIDLTGRRNEKKFEDNYRIAFFQQEKLISLPGDLDTLDDFIAHYKHWAQLDFEEECN